MISNQRQWIVRSVVAIGAIVLLYLFPLFHVVSLNEANEESAKALKFDPVAFVDGFWSGELLASESSAADGSQLLAAIRANPEQAQEAHGRKVGLSQTYFYFVTGVGRVVSVEKNAVNLAFDADLEEVDVALQSGILFGNTVRDGTGLLDVNDFNNTQEFNAISTELNRRIEADVLPTLREIAEPGSQIRFTGCVQIIDEESDLHPLRVIPFIVEAI